MTYYTLLTHGFLINKERVPIQKNSSSKKIPVIMYGTQGETTYPDMTILMFFFFSKLFGEPFLEEVVRALRKYPQDYEIKYTITNRSTIIQKAVKILFVVNQEDRIEMEIPQNKFRIFTNSTDPIRQPFNLKLETFVPDDRKKLSQAQVGRFIIDSDVYRFIKQNVEDDYMEKLCITKSDWPFENSLSLKRLLKKTFFNAADVVTLKDNTDKKLWIRFENDDGYRFIRHLIPLGLYKTNEKDDTVLQTKHVDSSLSSLLSDLKQKDDTFSAIFIFSCKTPVDEDMNFYLPEIYNLLVHDLSNENLGNVKYKKNMSVSQLQDYVKGITSKKLKRKQKKQRNTMQTHDKK